MQKERMLPERRRRERRKPEEGILCGFIPRKHSIHSLHNIQTEAHPLKASLVLTPRSSITPKSPSNFRLNINTILKANKPLRFTGQGLER